MKKIGFVDFYISEWHANNYPAWIAKACEDCGYSYEVAYAWAEEDVSPYDGKSTDEWCHDFGVQRCATIAELCEKSDVIIVLAPSNPEKHLAYVSETFKYGKRTYVDKTFAPDLKTSDEMFAIADEFGTPFFTSSALRYATELEKIDTGRGISTTGGGSNLPEYVIHQAEMVVKLMGKAEKIRARKEDGATVFEMEYKDGREAKMTYAPELSFTVTENGKEPVSISSPFFVGLIRDVLRFFETGVTSFDRAETREVMRLRNAALVAADRLGEWIEADGI